MALTIYDNYIEIIVPNSEAAICAQHVGIKDRTVGSYYMSESSGDVKSFLNNLNGNYYIDFFRTNQEMEELYEYIRNNDKEELFKSSLLEQYEVQNEILERDYIKHYVKICNPEINSNNKYLKFSRENITFRLFQNLLLGDLTKIIIYKLSDDSFVLYGVKDDNYKYKLDANFKY